MLHKLRNELGLDAVAIDKAGGVGGTWYWNKYPGALSDSEASSTSTRSTATSRADPVEDEVRDQPEVLAYLNSVVDRYDLGEHIHLRPA